MQECGGRVRLLTLNWVVSGLFSMNPWGFLDSIAGLAEGQHLAGLMTWGDVRGAAGQVPVLPAGAVRVHSAPLGGRVFLVAIDRDGRITRFDASGRPAPLGEAELKVALRNGPPVAALEKLSPRCQAPRTRSPAALNLPMTPQPRYS